jgi:hypothetical protein
MEHLVGTALFAGVTLAVLLWARPGAALSSSRFCAPPLYQLPQGHPPILDGTNPGNDPVWLGAFRYSVGNGTTDASAAVQMVKLPDNSMIYMTVEVPADESCSGNDGFVVAFDTGAGAPDPTKRFRRLEAFPFPLGGSCSSAPTPPVVISSYYEGTFNAGSAGQIDWHAGTAPANLKMGYGFQISGRTFWHLEIQIPVADFGLPTTGDFAMYWNVLVSHEAINAENEFSWPAQCEDGMGGTVTGGCIDALAQGGQRLCFGATCATPDTWGPVSLNTNSCKGVYISQINVSHPTVGSPLGWRIAPDGGNFFHALVTNAGADAATNVSARFRIANFGSNFGTNPWIDIQPVPQNPTDPAAGTIGGSSGSVDLTIGPWTPAPGLYEDDADPYGMGHQCVLVQLSSTSNVTFTSASTYTNMNIGTMSAFAGTALIDTRGLGVPTGGLVHRLAYFVKPVYQYAYGDGTYPGLALGRVASQVGWFFHPYRFTGQTVNIYGRVRNLVFPGPGFGYNVNHDMGDAFQMPFNQRHQALWNLVECSDRIGAPERGPEATRPPLSPAQAKKMAALQAANVQDGCFYPPDPRFYQALNGLLATDVEKPAAGDFQLRVDGMSPVQGGGGNWYMMDIPPFTVAKITANVGYGPGSLPPPPQTTRCSCDAIGESAPFGAAVGGIGVAAAVGASVWRRRRRAGGRDR